MEFDEIMVKESPGLCRCCLSEGCYKDMGTEYAWMNENEVYADMLLECFDISISQVNDGPNGPNRLICEVCITRLRDACYFKKQVLESEKKFIDMVGRGEFKSKAIMVYSTSMKVETAEEEDAASLGTDDADPEYLDDEIEYLEEDILKAESQEPGVSEVTADPLPVRGKRGRPRKAPVKADKKKVKTEPKPKSSKPVLKERDERIQNKKIRADLKLIMRLITLFSTIMPFRWSTQNDFLCYFCGQSFVDIAAIKQHMNSAHKTEKIEEITEQKNYFLTRIRLDVSDLSCKLCPTTLETLEELLDHLACAHELHCNKESALDNLMCVKLTEGKLYCLNCGERFNAFGTLLVHHNRYHNISKKFRCKTCGESYICKNTLYSHIYYRHEEKRCDICNLVFKTDYALKSHIEKIHETDKFKCTDCDEIFGSRYLQKKHFRLVHNVGKRETFCDICSKNFVTPRVLRDHKARVHLKERSYACEICGFKVFSRGVLTLHMVAHNEARPFACDVCQKTFRRKKTLQVHMKLHSNYRPYECNICDKKFIQNCALKTHIKQCHLAGSKRPKRVQ